MTGSLFDEDRLRADIASVWGEHGAHVDVFDRIVTMARKWAELAEVAPFDHASHGRGCWFRTGGPCDCTLKTELFYRRTKRNFPAPAGTEADPAGAERSASTGEVKKKALP